MQFQTVVTFEPRTDQFRKKIWCKSSGLLFIKRPFVIVMEQTTYPIQIQP